MVSMSLNYGYNFITKAIDRMEDYIKFQEFEKLLQCLQIPCNLEEETQFREFLIEKDLLRIERSGNLMEIDMRIDTKELSKLLKNLIKKADPSADFTQVKHFPDQPTVFLNNFKQNLLESCLKDLETKAGIFADNSNFVPEIKLKEAFEEVFPNFEISKIDSFFSLIDNVRAPTKLNSYQEQYNLTEVMHKIRQGERFLNSDLKMFKSSIRVLVEKTSKKRQRVNKLNGEFVPFKKPQFKVAKRPPNEEETLKKFKEIFKLIKENEEVQRKLAKGIYDFDPAEEEKRIKELPLTLPMIKYCVLNDVNETGRLKEQVFVGLTQEFFPSVEVSEAYFVAGFGYLRETGEVDYMLVVNELERRILGLKEEDSR